MPNIPLYTNTNKGTLRHTNEAMIDRNLNVSPKNSKNDDSEAKEKTTKEITSQPKTETKRRHSPKSSLSRQLKTQTSNHSHTDDRKEKKRHDT